jgi:ribonuclease P protein component
LTAPGKIRQKQAARGWFDRVFIQRKSYSGHFLQLHVGNTDQSAGSFGVSVSKRICPSSVSRNYVKRVLRAWYRAHRPLLRGQDLVIRVRRKHDRRDFPRVSRELDKLLSRFH